VIVSPKLVAAGALAALVAFASVASAAALSPRQVARMDSVVQAAIARQQIPGLTIAVVADGEIRWSNAYGLADVENQVPARTATLFRIASTSKPITAVAAMQLAERGKLDLDAPVQKYVPAFPVASQPVTTRQVLAHLGGIRAYKPNEGEQTRNYASLTAALDVFKDDSLVAAPGTRYQYTTFGYTLLGAVIEGASGMTYRDYLREHVLGPAGMTSTRPDDIAAIVPNRARGYSPLVYGRFDGKWKNAILMDPSYKIPGGGLLSTCEDLARFAIAVMSGKLLGRESFERMTTMQRTTDGKETGYGLGWYLGAWKGRGGGPAMWHGGVQPGTTAELKLLPRQRVAVAILANLEGGGRLGLGEAADAILDIALE
jgi:serine beta-lactamase-like protein LACTB, mitochondrial